MMNLFTNFDLYFFSFSCFTTTVMLMSLMSSIFKIKSFLILKKMFFYSLEKFYLSLKQENFNKNFIMFILSTMMILLFMNFTSVTPFIFPMTSTLSTVLSYSFNIWVSMMLFQIIWANKHFMSHCIPEGTPIYLTWFLFLIEIVSNLIRPVTLTVRLLANILAGHLLMILLSKLALTYNIIVSLYLLLNTVEMLVALIQAYIFSTMVTLYYSEMN